MLGSRKYHVCARNIIAKATEKQLQTSCRLHTVFDVGFSVLAVFISLASQSIVVPGLLGLIIIGSNGYLAYLTKQ